jgi:hypothetical protein
MIFPERLILLTCQKGISKKGDRYLRSLLANGAMAVAC